MSIGACKVEIKIGDMDVSGADGVYVKDMCVYNSVMNPYGPACEITVIDPKDALGKYKINGSFDKDVTVKITPHTDNKYVKGTTDLKMKMFKNVDLDDQSMINVGSGHYKTYKMRCVSPEALNAKGNLIEKSFNGKTSDVVKHVLENGFKTDKKIDLTETDSKRRIVIPRMSSMDVIKMMNTEHYKENSGSAFVLFQQPSSKGQSKYMFKTFDELFEQQSNITLKQSTTLNFEINNQQERQNSILWFKPTTHFDSSTRALSKTSEHALDLTSFKLVEAEKKDESKFKFADREEVYSSPPSYIGKSGKPIKLSYLHDKANNIKNDKHNTSKHMTTRADYLAKLAQTSCTLECYYNPEITVGSMINLDIFGKKDKDNDSGESHWNGPCLVTGVRIFYRSAAEPPNCTMVLELTKGGSYKKNSSKEG